MAATLMTRYGVGADLITSSITDGTFIIVYKTNDIHLITPKVLHQKTKNLKRSIGYVTPLTYTSDDHVFVVCTVIQARRCSFARFKLCLVAITRYFIQKYWSAAWWNSTVKQEFCPIEREPQLVTGNICVFDAEFCATDGSPCSVETNLKSSFEWI